MIAAKWALSCTTPGRRQEEIFSAAFLEGN
jgi:hypothetical protein